jgi:hypothetical protein
MFIYLTTNLINNKKYIGMCTRDDADSYLGSGTILKQSIRKYGKENFKRTILETCDDFDALCKAEKYWIEKYNAVDSSDFYNMIDGGHGGNSNVLKQYWTSMTPDERAKARKWNGHFCNSKLSRDVYDSEEWRRNVSAGVKSSWDNLTDEQLEDRKSKISKGIAKKRNFSGDRNPMAGRSIVNEKRLKWYTDGKQNLYVTENTQPDGFYRGRTLKRK